VYNSLLHAVTKSSQAGYNLGADMVAAAEALVADLRSCDAQPDAVTYAVLMDVYAKAGRCVAAV